MLSESPFRLGTLQSVLATRLRPLLPGLQEKLQLEVQTGHSRDLYKGLAEGRFDAVFAIDAPENPDILRARAIPEDVTLIYPDSHEPVQSQEDLLDLPFVTFAPGCSYRRRGLQWMAEQGLEPIAIEVVPDYAAIMERVAEGRGFGAIPDSVFRTSPLHGEVQADPVPGENGKVWVELLWRKNADQHAVRLIRDAMGI